MVRNILRMWSVALQGQQYERKQSHGMAQRLISHGTTCADVVEASTPCGYVVRAKVTYMGCGLFARIHRGDARGPAFRKGKFVCLCPGLPVS